MFLRYLVLVGVLALGSAGCGKDLKMSIKAAEAEKDGSAAALTRKVEVTYHDSAGKEQMRQSVAVLGLSQPVSLKSDFIKDVHWEKNGVWTAQGYSADGLILLRGTAQPDPDQTDTVEIELGGAAAQVTALGSAILRKVRITNAPYLSNFVLDAQDFRANKCVELPTIQIRPNTGVYPSLEFEGAIKASDLFVKRGGGAYQGIPVAINGNPALEIGPKFSADVATKKINRFEIQLYSGAKKQYEGCLSFSTALEKKPPVPLFISFEPIRVSGFAVGRFTVVNLNDYNMSVQVLGHFHSTGGSAPVGAVYEINSDANPRYSLNDVKTPVNESLTLGAKGTAVFFFKAFFSGGRVISGGFTGDWTVNSQTEDGDSLPTQTATGVRL